MNINLNQQLIALSAAFGEANVNITFFAHLRVPDSILEQDCLF